ncbi:MAG TPA: hypothetical protein VKA21_04170, partial [Candidatus Binatia bacterium]|nr:hypothetical protein [Candidatus Binatia bacterium]
DWLDAPSGDRAGAERAVEAMFTAARHVHAVEADVAGTWGAHDLELTHWFYAGVLRSRIG